MTRIGEILTEKELDDLVKQGIEFKRLFKHVDEDGVEFISRLPVEEGGLDYLIAKRIALSVVNVSLEKRMYGMYGERYSKWVFVRPIKKEKINGTEVKDAIKEIQEARKMFNESLSRLADLATGIKSQHFS